MGSSMGPRPGWPRRLQRDIPDHVSPVDTAAAPPVSEASEHVTLESNCDLKSAWSKVHTDASSTSSRLWSPTWACEGWAASTAIQDRESIPMAARLNWSANTHLPRMIWASFLLQISFLRLYVVAMSVLSILSAEIPSSPNFPSILIPSSVTDDEDITCLSSAVSTPTFVHASNASLCSAALDAGKPSETTSADMKLSR